MTRPRQHLLPKNTPLQVHCVQRCVRRAYLCGKDAQTGHDYSHRKAWVEQRIRVIAECFAVAVHAWAVMSNHLHLVLSIDPAAVHKWSDDDIARRWCLLYPPTDGSDAAVQRKMAAILAQPARVAVLREYLGDLSWLMKCLAEPIARRANAEDDCTGRFWEGRFKAQRLCDEAALLAAMAYVDLNPVRAGLAHSLAESNHTSAQARTATADDQQQRQTLLRPALGIGLACPSLTIGQYLQVLEWTGRALRPGKRGATGRAPQCLQEHTPQRWLTRVQGIESSYWRAIGAADDLIALARQMGQKWLKGVGVARALAA